MNRLVTYENIWARNILFGSLMFALMFTQTKFAPNIPNLPIPSDFDMVWQFMLMYVALFSYNHFIVRLYFFTKRYSLYALFTVIYILVVSSVMGYVERRVGVATPFLGQIVSSVMTLFIGTCVYFGHNWVLSNIVQTKIKLLNKEAEITFLKQQLSPHFLFNAINNLYGTALAEPEIITDKILELSDLLRYQVEATTKNKVAIEEEMGFVQNYINYTSYKSNDLIVTNKVEGFVDNIFVPPLLFLPLLENAVKYSSETDNAFIDIKWLFKKNAILFSIENSYFTEGSKIKGTKIGLENLKKRLELLNIKHELSIDLNTNNIYKIELKLWELSINA
jgi:two-component system, LytTR family, sensor kinase